MAVLATPFFLQFVDNDGVPVRNGKVFTYAAGTTTPKATFTDYTEAFQAPNPVLLDAAGRTTIWINGAYKFVLVDENDVVIQTTDNVTSFSTPAGAAEPFSQTFSGDGTNKNFTLTESMGDDPLNIFVFVDNNDGKGREVLLPSQYTLSGTSLVLGTAPAVGTNNVYVVAPSTLLGQAAASAQAAATSEANASASETAAAGSAVLAQNWATKTDGLVAATDNSAKAYAIGGTGVTNTAGKGAAKEWSTKTTGTVDGTEFSAKAYAIGGTGTATNNAKYYKEQAEALYGDLNAVHQAVIDAQAAVSDAEDQADNSAASALLSQAWATQTGSPVSGGQYGAKYYSDLAATFPPSSVGQTAQAAYMADGAGTSGWRNPLGGIAATVVPTSTDLNTITAPGWYQLSGANTYTNDVQSGVNRFMEVRTYSFSAQVIQTIYTSGTLNSTRTAYHRRYTGSAWEAWTQPYDLNSTWNAAQRGAVTALTDAATVTPNFATSNNFSWTIGGNRTLAAPSNQVAGQSGIIVITQDATGGRVITWNAAWKFANGVKPALSTAANAVDVLAYYVAANGTIICSLIPAAG